jgi:hypothetical protein
VAEQQTNWHHLFGLMMQDFFTGTSCEVELERDLSVKSQFLDVLILSNPDIVLDRVLPDGLQGQLVEHNLITFKSHRDTMNSTAIDELLAHLVNYRKQASPNFDDLLPEDRFRLFAIAARLPVGLFQQVLATEIQPGVYDIVWGVRTIRIIVANELPQTAPNALLHLFTASAPLVQYGRQNCRAWSSETSTLVSKLFADYRVEGLTMPVDRAEFIRNAKRQLLQECTPEERLVGLLPEQRLAGLPSEQRLDGVPPEQMLQRLTPEQRLDGLTPEQRLGGLTPAERTNLRRLLDDTTSP